MSALRHQRSPTLRELEPAERFSGFQDAIRYVFEIVSWAFPGSAPFVTRMRDGELTLDRAPDGAPGASRARGYVCMPMLGLEGQQLGSLCILDAGFSDSEIELVERLLEAMGRILVSELEREERERSMQHTNDLLRVLADTDSLTGLLNRASFKRMLRREWNRARRGEVDSRLVLVDVNGLKAVNDQFGHPRGDALLRDVAEALGEVARESDIVGRLGGDEFAVVLVGAAESGEHRFRERLDAAFAGKSSAGVLPSAAIGGTSLATARSPEEALEIADRRMYREKRCRPPTPG